LALAQSAHADVVSADRDFNPGAGDVTATAFSRLAERYDAEWGGNPVGRWMRAESLEMLGRRFQPGQRVLEIGCGTGEEAVALAKRGVQVVATDAAPGMVERTAERVRAAGVADRVMTRRMAAAAVERLVDEWGAGAFDGAFSSFGALNCEPDLAAVARGLGALVCSGGFVVCSVMNRFYPWEVLWFLARRGGRGVGRRWRRWIEAPVSPELSERVPCRYYRPAEFQRFFGSAFAVHECRALPLLVPPPCVATRWADLGPLWGRVARWERRLAGSFPCNRWGDHFLMCLQRAASSSPPAPWRSFATHVRTARRS
jgi:SAM-dependent methyltransferase